MLIWDDGVVWWDCQGNRPQGTEIIYILYTCNNKEPHLSCRGLTLLPIIFGKAQFHQLESIKNNISYWNKQTCTLLHPPRESPWQMIRRVTIKHGWNSDCLWPSFVSPERRKQCLQPLGVQRSDGCMRTTGMRLYENGINPHCFMLTFNHYEYNECHNPQIEKSCSDRAYSYYGVLFESVEWQESCITCPLVITAILHSLKK